MLDGKTLKVTRGAPPADRWGVVYRGVGELPDAMAEITRSLGILGALCEITRLADWEVAIEGETRKRWHRLLAGPHPQRVRGRVERLDPQSQGDSDGETKSDLQVSLNLSVLPSFRGRWCLLWCLFLQQHLGGSGLHYWHPAPDERAERIRRVEAITEAATTA